MFVGAAILTFDGITFKDLWMNFLEAVDVMSLMLVGFGVFFKPIFAKVNIFFVVHSALCLDVGGAAFYFRTDNVTQCPKGPHFSRVFVTTFMGVMECIGCIIGVYTYKKYCSSCSGREVVGFACIVSACLHLFNNSPPKIC